MKVVPKPWYLVGIDLIEAPTTSKKGNKYLLTQTDYFTKYVEAVPLPDKSAYSEQKLSTPHSADMVFLCMLFPIRDESL